MKTSEEAYMRPIELRCIHAKGCDANCCDDVDPMSETCWEASTLRLRAGMNWRKMQEATDEVWKEIYKDRMTRNKRAYFDHIYMGVQFAVSNSRSAVA